jgi:hypothetical protein
VSLKNKYAKTGYRYLVSLELKDLLGKKWYYQYSKLQAFVHVLILWCKCSKSNIDMPCFWKIQIIWKAHTIISVYMIWLMIVYNEAYLYTRSPSIRLNSFHSSLISLISLYFFKYKLSKNTRNVPVWPLMCRCDVKPN